VIKFTNSYFPAKANMGGGAMKQSNGNGKISREIFEMQAMICKSFANPIRLEILDLLGKREWVVGDMQKELGISKANMSQHISVLKGAGVVAIRREGKQFYCSLTIPEVKQACQLIHNVLRAQVRKGRSLQL
jgi:ArsR family transcriptional regulator, virulence genes transcriptional regulator